MHRLIGGVALAGAAIAAALLVSYGGLDRAPAAFDDLTGERVAQLAVDEMRSVRSVLVEGLVGVESTHISVRVAVDGTCSGTLSVGGARAEFRRIRQEPWLVKANSKFIQWAWGEEEVTDDIWLYAGRWLRTAGAPTGEGLGDPCDLPGVLEYAGVSTAGGCGKSGHAEVGGRGAVVLECAGPKRLYVDTRAPHHVLRVTRSGGDPRDLRFRNYDEEFEVDLPPDSEVINLTESI